MKNLSLKILAILFVSIMMSACDVEEALSGNEYQIKVDGKVYDEGSSLLAGIKNDPTNDEMMIAAFSTAIQIRFERSDYKAGEGMKIGLVDTNVKSFATGIIDDDSEGGKNRYYTAISGIATVVSKNKIEFNLICMDTDALNDEKAKTFTVSGYITEKNTK